MVGFLRTTAILAVIVLVFTLIIQAQSAPSKECPNPNEGHNICGSSCPETCGDILHLNTPKPCTHECVIGCFCENGYARENEEPTSRCIKTEECHSTD